MDLSDWRARIDTVDQILVDLLNKRMHYVLEIGKIKRAHGRQVRDAEREKAILDGLKAYNNGPLSDAAIADIFNRIMQEARNLEEGF
jgi:chorismate mutase